MVEQAVPFEKIECQSSHLLDCPKYADLAASNLVVVIPAYNEERFIGSVVLKVRQLVGTVIVVDDGSSDATANIAAMAGAIVARHPKNRGKGAALNTGFWLARGYRPSAVVTLDADGQHRPEDIAGVAAPVLKGQADIVIGSRYLSKNSEIPRHRIWGHWAFNWITRLSSGIAVTDSQSGYRAFSPRALATSGFSSDGFAVESEMQFLAYEHGLRLAEVPITIHYVDGPKRNVLAHGLHVLNGLLRLAGQYRPLLFFGLIGTVQVIMSFVLGYRVFYLFRIYNELAAGTAMLSVLSMITGVITLSTGIILHSVRGQLLDILKTHNGK